MHQQNFQHLPSTYTVDEILFKKNQCQDLLLHLTCLNHVSRTLHLARIILYLSIHLNSCQNPRPPQAQKKTQSSFWVAPTALCVDLVVLEGHLGYEALVVKHAHIYKDKVKL